MMKKTYLMKTVVAMAMAVVATGCGHDLGTPSSKLSDEEILANAEDQLGITIDPNQSWQMTSRVTANVSVNEDYGETYTVKFYQNNPFVDSKATLLGECSVVSGGKASVTFAYPKGTTLAYAALKDPKGYLYVKPVVLSSDGIDVTFGSTATRGVVEDTTIPVLAQPDVTSLVAGAVEISDWAASGESKWEWTAERGTFETPAPYVFKLSGGNTWNSKIAALGLTNSEQGLFARTFYIEDGTWTVSSDQPTIGAGALIIVGANGKVNIPAGSVIRTSGANGNYTARFIVLPGGEVSGDGLLEFANGTAEGGYGYNGGTINVGTINNNGGVMYNAGTMQAQKIEGGAGGSVYINAGHVLIGESLHGSSAANMQVLNNCWWEVTGGFACRDLVQGPGAYLKAATLEMERTQDGIHNEAHLYAGANSLVDITGAAAFNNVDIIGPTNDGDYGYIQLGSVGGDLKTAMNYSPGWGSDGEYIAAGAIQNNIRISVDNPETTSGAWEASPYEKILNLLNGENACSVAKINAVSDQWNQKKKFPTQGNGNARLVAKGEYTAAIVDASDCSPGITPAPPTPRVEEQPIYSYAFEDTDGGDYDMNDVVLKVQEFTDGDTQKLRIKLVAVGATLNLNILLYPAATPVGNEVAHYSGTPTALSYNNEQEVHAMLGVEEGVMVNTRSGANVRPIEIIIDKGDYDPSCLPLSIASWEEGEMRLAGAGEAPFGVIIPGDWKWPTERVRVTTAYNSISTSEGDQSFGTFASQYGSAEHWYNYPSQSVINEASLGY